MSEILMRPRHAMGTAGELKGLGWLWLAGAVLVAVPGYLLGLVSDHAADDLPGMVLAGLAVVGAALGTWLLVAPRLAAVWLSLVVSAVWLAGAAVVYPTQEFATDAVWVAGVPTVVALVSALVAGWALRAERRAASY